MNTYLHLSLLALISVFACVVIYVLDKRTRFSQINKALKQVIIGVIFGGLAIISTEFGARLEESVFKPVLNCRDASVLIAGLIFGAPAGLIAGFIGGVERYFAGFWGAGTYTQVACSISTIVAGIVGAILRKFLFEDKKPSVFYSFIIGLIVEIFHMLMIFFTNMDDVQKAFGVVQEATLPMVSINSLAVMLAVLLITLIGKERIIKDYNAKTISSLFQRWLLVTVLVAFTLISVFSSILQIKVCDANTESLLAVNIDNVKTNVYNTTNNNILSEFSAVDVETVYSSVKLNEVKLSSDEQDEQVTKRVNESLVGYLLDYNAQEISIVNKSTGIIKYSIKIDKDENGIIFLDESRTKPSFSETEKVGVDMKSNANSEEFFNGIKAVDEYNEINATSKKSGFAYEFTTLTASSSIPYKYVGTHTEDREYYFLFGYDEQRFVSFVEPNLKLAIDNRTVGKTGYLVAIDGDGFIIACGRPEFLGKNIEDTDGIKSQEKSAVIETKTLVDVACYYMLDEIEGYYLVSLLPKSEAVLSKDLTIYITVFMEIIAFVTMFILIYLLIKKLIVNNINKVNNSLSEITGGNLDVVVNVRSNEEFASLSDDINSTVLTLKHYISEAAARIDKELEFAKAIQHSALPSVFPPFPDRNDFDIYALMDTAKEVGGDFYDFFFVGIDKLAFLIADVSGKGIPAAMFMMTAKTLIKNYAESGKSVNDIFTYTNKKLCENNEANMFVTAWMGIIDLKTGVVEFVNAGHNPPLIKRKNGKYEYLRTRPGFVLAGMDGIKYKSNEITLEKGDRIFLYTDGVTEATNVNNELFGEDRLLNTLNTHGNKRVKEICDNVKNDVDSFVDEAEQFDDITMLTFYYKGEIAVKEIQVEAIIDNVSVVTDFINSELDAVGCPVKAKRQIDVAIDEIFSNISNYAYSPEVGTAQIKITFEDTEKVIRICFADSGKEYNPLEKETPDLTLSADERQIGGLGIYVTKMLTDDIEYERIDGKNILTITKRL